MANEAKFTHISVTIDDDDDFVIEAGASEPVPEPESELAPAPEPEPVFEPEPEPVLPAVEEELVPVREASKPTQYRETTLEDLEVEKMSGVQKGVIAAAFIAIIAFAVWYLVL